MMKYFLEARLHQSALSLMESPGFCACKINTEISGATFPERLTRAALESIAPREAGKNLLRIGQWGLFFTVKDNDGNDVVHL